MAVPFYLPEGGADDVTTSGSSSTSSDGASSASSQSSPNTTTSATQTPMQSPCPPLPGEQLVLAICEAMYRLSINTAQPIFQYPPPPSPSYSVHSPSYTGGEVFFPRGRSTPRTPRTSVSFAGGEELSFFRYQPTTSSANTTTGPHTSNNCSGPPQSAPPMPSNYHYQPQYYYPYAGYSHYMQNTPPPTPTIATATTTTAPYINPNNVNCSTATTSTSTSTTGTWMATGSVAAQTSTSRSRLHRSHSDVVRRSRLTSTGEEEREYQSEHETSWDELDDRFDNFTAGRERLQEFSGRIPPRKKKKEVPKPKGDKKEHSYTITTVVAVFLFAMGWGIFVSR